MPGPTRQRGGGEPLPEPVAAMLDPGLYPSDPPEVELRETHISWVLLAGDRAYKVKKPLTLPFLDYGTLERRREMCREEVRLNRRLAPRIYLGVVAIVRRDGGFAIAPEDNPAAIEYAVEMRRVEEDRSLEALAARGELRAEQVEAVAQRLARFHAEAPLAAPELRRVEVLAETLEENLTTLREVGGALVGDPLAAAERFTSAFLSARRDDFEARGREGHVRDCHGDLRAEHVIVPEREEIYVYDCVEFNPALRGIDVAADLAFLVMELARLGAEDLAVRLVAEYRRAGGDPGDDAPLAFLAAYRAWVRAKVALLRAAERERGDPGRRADEEEALQRFRLGRRFAWRARLPLLLVVCGVAASGKTTLADELAAASGLPHISSDVTRKRLAGLKPDEPAGEEHYSGAFTERTYRELGAAARRALESDGGAIVDATFHLRSERAAFGGGLGTTRAPTLFFECRAPAAVLAARARSRQPKAESASDAGPAIVERQLAARQPLEEVSERWRATLDAEAPPQRLAVEVERLLDARLWPPTDQSP